MTSPSPSYPSPRYLLSICHLNLAYYIPGYRVIGRWKVPTGPWVCPSCAMAPYWIFLPGLFGAWSIFRTFFFLSMLFVVLQIWHKD